MASKKFTQLPSASTLVGDEIAAAIQGGNSVQFPLDQLADLFPPITNINIYTAVNQILQDQFFLGLVQEFQDVVSAYVKLNGVGDVEVFASGQARITAGDTATEDYSIMRVTSTGLIAATYGHDINNNDELEGNFQTFIDRSLWQTINHTTGQAVEMHLDLQGLTVDAPIGSIAVATVDRPDPVTSGAGAMIYDSDLKLPLWSDGTSWRPAAESSGGALLGLYKADANTVGGAPANGFIRWNNATQINSTGLNISDRSSDGFDLAIVLGLIAPGRKLLVQDQDTATNYQIWTMSGAQVDHGTYWSFPVTLTSSAGTGTTGFSNNHQLFIAIGG